MRVYMVIAALLMSLPIGGCIMPQQVRKMEGENAALRDQVDSLRLEVGRLRASLSKAELPALQAKESVLRAGADTELRLNQFTEQLRVLNDRVDDLDNRVTNFPNKLRLAAERVSTAPPAVAASPELATNDPGSQAPPRQPETAADKGGNFTEKTNATEPSKLYDMAYQDLVRGQYSLAREGFLEFLRRYPQSTLADNAQYWIGESYYSQQQYARAAAEFGEVTEKYTNSDKVPGAMLKRAFALISMSKRAEARTLLEQLVKKYPNSQEAELARARLKDL
ncbi:MAG: tol-pal system protein YbgF [bacterium]